MYSVMETIESIRLILNLHKQPPAENFSPAEAKLYLEGHSLKYCVLVVDGETVKDSYDNLPERKVEYVDLLETAVKRVGKTRFHCNQRNKVSSLSSLNVSLERTPGKERFNIFSPY